MARVRDFYQKNTSLKKKCFLFVFFCFVFFFFGFLGGEGKAGLASVSEFVLQRI